ncbi:pro-melanin-concentrating hormone, like [Thunnus thynnus]|uniref:pro-melanin-concentrating hormone, like n=1 Tax=Thunnus maccoyii TaxID=8240 RepID=UPI001C4BB84F|nr:pro-melanin-concentrating hormone, like [Thunnus maccoyii]XP_042251678.1 pro-melanin-concentrating hormone, like [Thunnus maccoyii]
MVYKSVIRSQSQNNEARALERNSSTKPTPYISWKIFTMRQSLMSVIFAAALLFECYALSVALPMGKTEDSSLEQDTFASLLSDEGTENSLADADLAAASKTRGPRVIVVADPSLWRDLRVLHNGPSFYKRRAEDNSQVIEHKDAGQDLSIPILRRDTMRCMVGRVYRPCWEV